MKTDIELIKKRAQARRIFHKPYRKGINYLKLVDFVRGITNELYSRSVDRAINYKKNNKMKTEPQTIETIKETIQHCKNIQLLEQITIDALENKLKHLESEKIKDAMIKTAKGKIIKHALRNA